MPTKKNKKMIGGIPIYPGGYSSVFKPQLKCKTRTKKIKKTHIKSGKNNNNTDGHKGISKLLFKKYADIEMRNIEQFYNALIIYRYRINIFYLQKQELALPIPFLSATCEGLMKCAQILHPMT